MQLSSRREPTLDERNRGVWAGDHTVRGYGGAQGFCDRGEEALYEVVRARLRDATILDLGVGGGRTVPLLRPLARRYVAIDYTPAMVEVCRRRFPELDVRVGDARDLSAFADGSFDLVMFSFNGIDAVDHEARAKVLREVQRVLAPSGLFWFSTLNIAGLGRKLRPWVLDLAARPSSPLAYAREAAHWLLRRPKLLWRYALLRPRFTAGDGWCTDTLSAHDYSLLMHYTSLSRQLEELAETGFAPEHVVDSGLGQPVSPSEGARDTFWFQILARRP